MRGLVPFFSLSLFVVSPLAFSGDAALVQIDVNHESLTLVGDVPNGVDIYARGPRGTVLVAQGVQVNGKTELSVPFYPDSVYFASQDGGHSALGGITSSLTAPSPKLWGLTLMVLMLVSMGIFLMERRRLAI